MSSNLDRYEQALGRKCDVNGNDLLCFLPSQSQASSWFSDIPFQINKGNRRFTRLGVILKFADRPSRLAAPLATQFKYCCISAGRLTTSKGVTHTAICQSAQVMLHFGDPLLEPRRQAVRAAARLSAYPDGSWSLGMPRMGGVKGT